MSNDLSAHRYEKGLFTVESSAVGKVTLHLLDDAEPIVLEVHLLTTLFEIGMRTPERDRSGWVPLGYMEADDDHVRFLVGATDVGPDLGMAAVARGLVVAIERWLDEYREHGELPPEPSSADDGGLPGAEAGPRSAPRDASSSSRGGQESDRAVRDMPGVVTVPYERAVNELAELIERVLETGEHIVIEREQEAIAAIVPFDWYRGRREHLARLEAAYWTAWRDGRWDAGRYAEELRVSQVLVHDSADDPSPSRVQPEGDAPATDEVRGRAVPTSSSTRERQSTTTDEGSR